MISSDLFPPECDSALLSIMEHGRCRSLRIILLFLKTGNKDESKIILKDYPSKV